MPEREFVQYEEDGRGCTALGMPERDCGDTHVTTVELTPVVQAISPRVHA